MCVCLCVTEREKKRKRALVKVLAPTVKSGVGKRDLLCEYLTNFLPLIIAANHSQIWKSSDENIMFD